MQQRITTAAQLGTIVRTRRKARGLSQAEVAAKLAVSQGRLSALEGAPEGLGLERLLAWVHLLGLELVVQDRPSPARETDW